MFHTTVELLTDEQPEEIEVHELMGTKAYEILKRYEINGLEG